MQTEYKIKELYEQGRKNICETVYQDQFKEDTDWDKSSRADICKFLSKLLIISPISSFESEKGIKHFRVLQIIENDYDEIIVKNIEKLDTLGIEIYLNENEDYIIKVKDIQYGAYMCPPDITDIVRDVFRHILTNSKFQNYGMSSFYKNIAKLIRD